MEGKLLVDIEPVNPKWIIVCKQITPKNYCEITPIPWKEV